MNEFLQGKDAGIFFIIVGLVLAFVTVMCFVFLIKSYKAGIKMGMDKNKLKKVITSSATFTLLPSVSILLGVIALSTALGTPFSWLRLSVIGSLQYELQVAGIAGKYVDSPDSMAGFVTIGLVMTAGIVGGIICCIFFLKKYMSKLSAKPKTEEVVTEKKPNFGEHATTAMFVGLCAAYIGAYIGQAIPRENSDFMPLFTAGVAAIVMALFEYLIQKKNMKSLENFSLAASMLVALAAAITLNILL